MYVDRETARKYRREWKRQRRSGRKRPIVWWIQKYASVLTLAEVGQLQEIIRRGIAERRLKKKGLTLEELQPKPGRTRGKASDPFEGLV